MYDLLVISQAIGPVGGSHSTRVSNFLKEIPRRDFKITALTTKIYPGTPDLDYSLYEKFSSDVKIIYSYPGPLHAFFYRKPFKGSKIVSSSRTGLKKFLIPDTYIEWLPGACYKALTYYSRRTKPDIILSSAVPYTSHLISLILSFIWGVPFVADYGDPWVYDPGHPKKGFRFIFEKFLEVMVVKKAVLILVTTENTKKLYVEKYNLNPSKVKVVPMGYDPQEFKLLKIDQESNNFKFGSKIKFTYTGRIEPESRDSNNFFLALKKLNDLNLLQKAEFIFIGAFPDELLSCVKRYGLSEHIIFKTWIAHSECMKMLILSDFLILFGNNNNIQVPGKLFNYIGSGTPVIYFRNYEFCDDQIDFYLNDSETKYFNVGNDVEEIFTLIKYLINSSDKFKVIGKNNQHTWSSRGKLLSIFLIDKINEHKKIC